MTIAKLYSYKYVFPVIGGDPIDDQDISKGIKITQVYGTAFHIGMDSFITAGHVLSDARCHDFFGLGFLKDRQWLGMQASEDEIIPSYDIGILNVPLPEPSTLKWKSEEYPMLHEVMTSGFPYALDLMHLHISVRSFKGYIVSVLTSYEFEVRPRVYELSFQCPRGLSGAPLFTSDPEPVVIGVISKNHSIEMRVMLNREKVVEGTEKMVERYETLQLGIAIQSGPILGIQSQILGTTLGDHVYRANLMRS